MWQLALGTEETIKYVVLSSCYLTHLIWILYGGFPFFELFLICGGRLLHKRNGRRSDETMVECFYSQWKNISIICSFNCLLLYCTSLQKLLVTPDGVVTILKEKIIRMRSWSSLIDQDISLSWASESNLNLDLEQLASISPASTFSWRLLSVPSTLAQLLLDHESHYWYIVPGVE